MITLQQIIEKYKFFGLSDYEIIRQFFFDNHLEDRAISLIAELSARRVKELNRSNSMLKEFTTYISSVLMNDMPFETKMKLYNMCSSLIWRDLEEEELNEAKEIFENYDIKVCWIIFYNYLISKGCIKDKKLNSYEEESLKDTLNLLRGNQMSKSLTEQIKKVEGTEYATNNQGIMCQLVPIDKARKQDKQDKVLEIVINKCVDIYELKDYIEWKLESEEATKIYNDDKDIAYQLTLKEFDLIKEAVKEYE